LRKYEDVLKVQELVTKAEHSYNRIEGYSKMAMQMLNIGQPNYQHIKKQLTFIKLKYKK
jgi:hypothetical protein